MYFRLTGEIDHHRAGELMRQLDDQLDLESPPGGGAGFERRHLYGLQRHRAAAAAAPGAGPHRRETSGGAGAQAVSKVLKAAGLGRLFSISYADG